MILFDVPAISGGVGAGLAVAVFLIFATVAFVAFKILKKTVKMAVRMAIVAIMLLIALIGGISVLYFSSTDSGNSGAKPPNQQKSR
jgi:uncharacterized membrane protein YoaT (DUF817 family)